MRPDPRRMAAKLAEKHLTEEEKKLIESLGGFDKLMETLKQRLEEQKGRHQGGSKWIGTAGTSPFGAYGYNPEGVRIGQDESRHRRAVKVWDKREFRNLDDTVELGTRNIKVALKRLRQWVRDGAAEELDLDGTIRDGRARLSRRQDPARAAQRRQADPDFSTSAGRWTTMSGLSKNSSPPRAPSSSTWNTTTSTIACTKASGATTAAAGRTIPTHEVMNTYGSDYGCIFVGDASMSPYEIACAGRRERALERGARAGLADHFHKVAWLNPMPEAHWSYTHSTGLIRHLFADRMFPMTLSGLEAATRQFTR
jgi:uncharacterized protein with von Willebrand factor type A (vWA) domain